jgi:hypothetical protein
LARLHRWRKNKTGRAVRMVIWPCTLAHLISRLYCTTPHERFDLNQRRRRTLISGERSEEQTSNACQWSMDIRLAARAGDRRPGRLRSPSLKLPGLGNARWESRRERPRRLQSQSRPLSPLCGADLPVGLARADRAQAQTARRRYQRVRGRAAAHGAGLALR